MKMLFRDTRGVYRMFRGTVPSSVRMPHIRAESWSSGLNLSLSWPTRIKGRGRSRAWSTNR
jgi:hypothetical protein